MKNKCRNCIHWLVNSEKDRSESNIFTPCQCAQLSEKRGINVITSTKFAVVQPSSAEDVQAHSVVEAVETKPWFGCNLFATIEEQS
jgi:hypothetical protein